MKGIVLTRFGATALRTGISGLLLSLVLTIHAYGQSPSAPPSAAQATTAYFIKFKVKPGRNIEFEQAIGEVMVAVRQKEPGNIYCDLLHLPQDPQTYVIIERYRDVAAVKAHSESEYIKKLGATLKSGLLDVAPDVQELVFIHSK